MRSSLNGRRLASSQGAAKRAAHLRAPKATPARALRTETAMAIDQTPLAQARYVNELKAATDAVRVASTLCRVSSGAAIHAATVAAGRLAP
jgi:hypothetical protein